MILDKHFRLPYYNELINPEGTLSIGVFGDSYAKGNNKNISKWWNYLLAKKLQVKSYTNYGHGGTSFYYSYNIFLENHYKHDIVVIAVTDPARFHSSISLDSLGERKITHLSGIPNIDTYIKDNRLTSSEKELLISIEHWYMVNSLEYAGDMQELMINQIINLRPDAIIVPCFSMSLTTKMFAKMNLTPLHNLYQMTLIQAKSLGINLLKEKEWKENIEEVNCHFTDEMNQYVAEIVYDKYLSGEWHWNLPKSISHDKSLSYYYNKS